MDEPDEIDPASNLPVFEFSSAIFEELQKGSPPDPLYHYTGQEGLLGIITDGELRATKVQYMNDSTEFGRAINLARQEIDKRTQNSNDRDRGLFASLTKNITRIANINVCSVSFCRNPDLLSQWRGYSGSGVGYAIGFCSAALLEVAHDNNCRLGRCIYDELAQVKIVNELMDQVVYQAARHRASHAYTVNVTLASAFEKALIKLGAFFKDAAFSEEDEWRIVTDVKFYKEKSFGFRAGKSMLVPFYKLDVMAKSWKNKITDVMIGPCPHPDLSRDAIAGLFINQWVTTDGWASTVVSQHPEVRISKIPYRSW